METEQYTGQIDVVPDNDVVKFIIKDRLRKINK